MTESEQIVALKERIEQLKRQRRDAVTELLLVMNEKGVRALRDLAQKRAKGLGVPLPDGWIPTAVMEQIEREADEAGWPR